MAVDDLDLECVATTKLEANSPGAIDGHRPLALSIASELVPGATRGSGNRPVH
jgi:hypothetical protein